MEHEQNIDISVIIPIYNVSEFLIPCLESVSAAIHDLNIEVLLIDDGSTDDSGELAKRYAESHPEFVFYHKENGGLGSARNYGIDRASGKYLMFLDSDDLVEPDIYDNMFAVAERTQSDVTICNVSRFDSNEFWASGLHLYVFNNLPSRETMHIRECPNLFYCAIVCDKLIRRDFFLRNGLRFPEAHVLYEDIPVALPMLYMANHVAFVRKAEYLWRIREGESKSITQNTGNLKNLLDRISALKSVLAFYQKVPEMELLRQFQIRALRLDLIIFVDRIATLPNERAEVFMARLNEFIDAYIDKELTAFLPIVQRQKYEYLFRGDREKLVEAILYGKKKQAKTAVIREGDIYLFDVPPDLFTLEDKSAQNDFSNAEPDNNIDSISLEDGVLEIGAHLFHPRIEAAREEDLEVDVTLVGDVSVEKHPLPIRRTTDGLVTERYGGVFDPNTRQLDRYNYDHAGFSIRIDLKELSERLTAEDNYYFECRYKTPVNEGISSIRRVMIRYREKHEQSVYVTERFIFRIYYDTLFRLFLQAQAVTSTAALTADRETGVIRVSGPETAPLVFDAAQAAPGVHRFPGYRHCRILSDQADAGDGVLRLKDVFVAVGRDRNDELLLVRKDWLPRWEILRTDGERGTYRISVLGAQAEGESLRLFIYDRVSGEKRYLSECALERDGDGLTGSGTVVFDLDLMNGAYEIRAELDGLPDETVMAQGQREFLFHSGERSFCVLANGAGEALVRAFREWPEGQLSVGEREYIRKVRYEQFRKEPVQSKTVLFESMWGTKYGNNPKAFYEYLDKHHPEYTCVWSLMDLGTPIPGRGIKVRRGTEEYYRYLATAKYLVNDVNFENAFKKRGGQIMIETMHGTPYKTIGLDSKGDFPTQKSVESFVRKTMFWDYLVSQGKFLDDKAFGAYKFYKTLLKTGYPRTDAIMQRDNERAESLKQQLGLPQDKKLILYAPTWRVHNDFDLKLDPDKLAEAIGDDYVFALRIHHLSAAHFKSPADGIRVFDLTSFSNIEDLYQITDVLITDYSSVMFDFVLTGKPTVFYAYDLQEYEENLRGVYFDLRTEAPGPIAYSEEELYDVLANLERETARYEKRTQDFIQKYLSYENPNSSELIFQQVFVEGKRSAKTRALGKMETLIDHHLPARFRRFYRKQKIRWLCRDQVREE